MQYSRNMKTLLLALLLGGLVLASCGGSEEAPGGPRSSEPVQPPDESGLTEIDKEVRLTIQVVDPKGKGPTAKVPEPEIVGPEESRGDTSSEKSQFVKRIRAAETWAVCKEPGQETGVTPWPDGEACSRLGENPELLKKISASTKDLVPIEEYRVVIEVDGQERLVFETLGSGTYASRWRQIKKALGEDAWQQAIQSLPPPRG